MYIDLNLILMSLQDAYSTDEDMNPFANSQDESSDLEDSHESDKHKTSKPEVVQPKSDATKSGGKQNSQDLYALGSLAAEYILVSTCTCTCIYIMLIHYWTKP